MPQVLEEYGDTTGKPHPLAWFVRMPYGQCRYEANDVPEARRELERGFEGAGVFGFGRVLAGFAVGYLALARQATGSPEVALNAVRTTSLALRVAGITNRLPTELEARIELLQGNLDAAARWADQPAPEVQPGRQLPPAGARIRETPRSAGSASPRAGPEDAAPRARRRPVRLPSGGPGGRPDLDLRAAGRCGGGAGRTGRCPAGAGRRRSGSQHLAATSAGSWTMEPPSRTSCPPSRGRPAFVDRVLAAFSARRPGRRGHPPPRCGGLSTASSSSLSRPASST